MTLEAWIYVDHLIGPHTVNTLPPDSIDAVMDHGTVKRTVDQDLEEAKQQLHQLAELDIDIDRVTDELLDEGVASFSDSYRKLIENLQQKSDRVQAGRAT